MGSVEPELELLQAVGSPRQGLDGPTAAVEAWRRRLQMGAVDPDAIGRHGDEVAAEGADQLQDRRGASWTSSGAEKTIPAGQGS